jgi:hypothetical protein
MIRHVFLWKVAPGADGEQIIRILAALPPVIPGIRRWEIGPHKGPRRYESIYDGGLTMDFDSLEDYEAYSDHPEHQRVLPLLAPMFSSRAVVDFELRDVTAPP